VNFNLSFMVVIAAALIAVVTDLRERIIYRRITVPLFLGGLFLSWLSYRPYFAQITLSKKGAYIAWCVLEAWLGPVVLAAILMIFLFWLGVLGGGDGHFMIAVTPWMGPIKTAKTIQYLFPLLLIYLTLHLIHSYEFKIRKLAQDQLANTVILFKNLPVVAKNITCGDAGILEKNIPYVMPANNKKPPAMVAIFIAILMAYLNPN